MKWTTTACIVGWCVVCGEEEGKGMDRGTRIEQKETRIRFRVQCIFICNEHLWVQNFMELVRYISIVEFRHSKVLKDQLNVSLCKATHFGSLEKEFVNFLYKHYHR